MPDNARPIGPGEAARLLGVSPRTVQRWLREGRLPAVQIGSRLKVDARAFAAPTSAGVEPTRTAATARSTGTGGRPTSAPRRIDKLLIADRGWVVPRIARTARGMHVTTLALVTRGEWARWWARQADVRVPLATDYADLDAVLDAARRSGADAFHPGCGSLAMSADLAAAVVAAGMTWVGAPAAALRAIGDPESLGRLAASAGVPVTAEPSSPADATRGSLIEVQLLLDAHGAAIFLGERDSSRRRDTHTLIDEAPSPAITAAVRARLGRAATDIAKAAGLVGAVTVSFVADLDNHPVALAGVAPHLGVASAVSEAVSGRDLVADQLRIAAGGSLDVAQADVTLRGHAIQATLRALDPRAGFSPAAGTIVAARWPSGPGVRVEASTATGDVISTDQPHLGTIGVHAANQATARKRLDDALSSTAILGVTTDRGWLRSRLTDEARASERSDDELPSSAWDPGRSTDDARAYSCAAAVLDHGRAGFRLNASPSLRIEIDGRDSSVPVDALAATSLAWARDGDGVVIDLDGRSLRATLAAPAGA